jgi:sugar/nucleoside kinase (ribokinase family)
MIEHVIYGKIIEDDVVLTNGELVRGVLGGGGPQACFGARLWTKSVGILSRVGTDIDPKHLQTLKDLDIDIQGVKSFEDIPTMRSRMAYDENEYGMGVGVYPSEEVFYQLLSQDIPIPEEYQRPKGIHLITEYIDEPITKIGLALREEGVILSLEPLIDYRTDRNISEMLSLIRNVDVVTPDWPSASKIAKSDNPKEVLSYWSEMGPGLVAVRDGKNGSYVWDSHSNKYWHILPTPVDVVDPTGGGNTYGGGLFGSWSETKDGLTSGINAAVSAYFIVGQYGIPAITEELLEVAAMKAEETRKMVEEL